MMLHGVLQGCPSWGGGNDAHCIIEISGVGREKSLEILYNVIHDQSPTIKELITLSCCWLLCPKSSKTRLRLPVSLIPNIFPGVITPDLH